MNQCIEYEILTKCSKIRDNYIFLRDKIIILIKIRSSKVARNCEVELELDLFVACEI